MRIYSCLASAILVGSIAMSSCLATESREGSLILRANLKYLESYCALSDIEKFDCELWALASHILDQFFVIDNDSFKTMLLGEGGDETYLFTDVSPPPGCKTKSIFAFFHTCRGENWALHYRECHEIHGRKSFFVYLLPSTEGARPTHEDLEVRVSDGAFLDDYVGTRVIKVDRGWRIVNPFRPDECSARK